MGWGRALTEGERERQREREEPRVENRGERQRWEEMKYKYYVTVLK